MNRRNCLGLLALSGAYSCDTQKIKEKFQGKPAETIEIDSFPEYFIDNWVGSEEGNPSVNFFSYKLNEQSVYLRADPKKGIKVNPKMIYKGLDSLSITKEPAFTLGKKISVYDITKIILTDSTKTLTDSLKSE